MNPSSPITPNAEQRTPNPPSGNAVFDRPRDFLENRFVYAVVSPRSRGLSVGVNLNPDRHCNFDCAYCEVSRTGPVRDQHLDVPTMVKELEHTLQLAQSGHLRNREGYQRCPPELLELKHVALSGDGEPTLCANFRDALEAVVHLRASGRCPYFKIVLVTNATGLDRPEVGRAVRLLKSTDEIWAKLDAGTQAYMDRVNRPDRPLEHVLANITALAKRRPVMIQSLFPALNGEVPDPAEIEAYLGRLREMKQASASIPLVQIYSATRPTAQSACGHLPLRVLSDIARRVRVATGLTAEVF